MDGEYNEEMCMKKPKRHNADRRWTTKRLREGNLDGLLGRAHGAATTGTGHDGVVTTSTTVAGVALEEIVIFTLLARVGNNTVLLLALENALLHAGLALGANGADVAALHVDVTGDIESTVLAEGDLPPCLVKTTEVGELGVAESRGASRGNVWSERDDSLLSRLETNGDLGLVDVQGHSTEAVGLPTEDDGILVGIVCELGLPVAIIANPHGAVVALVVLASGDDAERLDDALDTLEKVGNNITDIADEVSKVVGRGRSGGRSARGGHGGRRSSRSLDLLDLDSLSGAGGSSLRRGLLLDGGGGGLGGRSRGRGSEDGAPVDLVPVDVVEVVGDGLPVDIVVSRALSVTTGCQRWSCRLYRRSTYA